MGLHCRDHIEHRITKWKLRRPVWQQVQEQLVMVGSKIAGPDHVGMHNIGVIENPLVVHVVPTHISDEGLLK